MLKMTGYVMGFAPIAVFGALANVVCVRGVGILGPGNHC
jgi:Na+/H+-dicarboxylate symporter